MAVLVVWFDGGCPLCRREISLMRRLDRTAAIRFVDVSVEQSGCPIDPAALLSRFHALEDGRLLSGAAAFAAMWRTIPIFRPIGLAARHPLLLTILEGLYRRFLRVRPRLQRLVRRLDGRALGRDGGASTRNTEVASTRRDQVPSSIVAANATMQSTGPTAHLDQ